MRQRAADDAEAIYENIQRLKREREQMLGKGTGEIVQPPCDTEQPRMEDYACGWGPIVDYGPSPSEVNRAIRRILAFSKREPGEHTGGA